MVFRVAYMAIITLRTTRLSHNKKKQKKTVRTQCQKMTTEGEISWVAGTKQ